jgi:hypothetical protein
MNVYLYSPIDIIVKCEDLIFPLEKFNPQILTGATENTFVEFCPSGNFLPCFAFPFRRHLSQNVRIIDLYEGILLIPKLLQARNLPHKKLFASSVNYFSNGINFSVLVDGAPKLVADGAFCHEEIELPFVPKEWKLAPHSELPLVVVTLKDKKTAVIVLTLPELKPIFQTISDEVEIGEQIVTTTFHKDIAKHQVTDIWNVGEKVTHSGHKVRREKNTFHSDAIPYVFLEEVALGGDYQAFLSGELAVNSSLIPDFLGEFDYAIAPLLSSKPNSIILVCGENARFVKFSVECGKIVDIDISD